MTSSDPRPLLSPLGGLILWCSGSAPENVVFCPQDERWKHQAIGLAVVSTTLLALVSGTFAVTMISNSQIIGFTVGPIWAFFILNLDRLLVASMSKQENNLWLVLVPRLALATVIALLISTPLVVWVFHDEIDMELMHQHNAEIDGADQIDFSGYNTLVEAIKTANENFKSCISVRDELKLEFLREYDGTGGSGVPGYGDKAIAKEGASIIKGQECDKINGTLTSYKEKLNKVADSRNTEISRRQEKIEQLYENASLTTRHRILWRLAMKNFGILLPYFCITAILWLIEVIPVSAKFSMLINGQLVIYEVAMDVLRKEREQAIEEWSAEKEAEHNLSQQTSQKISERYENAVDTSLKQASVLNSIREHVEEAISSAIKRFGNSLFEHFREPTKSTDEQHVPSSPVATYRFPTLKKWTQRAFAIGIAVFVVAFAMSIHENPGILQTWEAVKVIAGALFALIELILLIIDIGRVKVPT